MKSNLTINLYHLIRIDRQATGNDLLAAPAIYLRYALGSSAMASIISGATKRHYNWKIEKEKTKGV